MNMKRVRSILLLLGALHFSAAALASSLKPNVLLFYADDMGYGDPGCDKLDLFLVNADGVELLADDLNKRFEDAGVPEMLDKIADETVATDPSQIRRHMEQTGHPALDMDDMTVHVRTASEEAVRNSIPAGG